MRNTPRLNRNRPEDVGPSSLDQDLWYGWMLEREGPKDDPTRLSATHIVTGQTIDWKRPPKPSMIGSSITSWLEGLRALTRLRRKTMSQNEEKPNYTSTRLLLQSERCQVTVEPKPSYQELAKAAPEPIQVLEVSVKLSNGQTLTIKPVQEGTTFSWSHGATKEARAEVYETYHHMTKEEAASRAEEDLQAMLDGKSAELRKLRARREPGEGQPVGCSFSDWAPGSKDVATWSFWRSADGLWSFGKKTEASFTPKGCELKDELTGTWDEAEKRFAELSRGA